MLFRSQKINENFRQKNLGTYQKNDENLYQKLTPYVAIAIQNAKWLDAKYTSELPAKRNPCTKVYELVELLHKYI